MERASSIDKPRDKRTVFDSSSVFSILNDSISDSDRYQSESDREAEKDGEAGDDLSSTCPPELANTPPPGLEVVSQ